MSYLGWCPNAGTLRTAPSVVPTELPHSIHDIPQPGASSGSGRRNRGLLLFMGSFRILRENMSLVWYSLFAAILALFFFAQFTLQDLPLPSGIPVGAGILPAQGTFLWLLCVISLGLIVECWGVMITIGIMYSVRETSRGRKIDLRESLSFAAQRTVRAYGYILILTVATIIPPTFRAFFPGSIPAGILSGMAGVFELVFAISTLFVIPILAFETESFSASVDRSVSWLKRLWVEIITGALLYLLVSILIFFALVLVWVVPSAAGGSPFTPPERVDAYFIFGAIMVIEMAVLTLLGSIFLFGLYAYAQEGTIPPSFDKSPKTGTNAHAPGRFGRGFDLAKESVGLIRKNTAILIFSLLTGLTIEMEIGTQYLIDLMTGSGAMVNSASVIVAKGSLSWLSLIFTTSFAGHLLGTFVVASLFTVVSVTLAGRIPTVHEGLANAWLHLRTIAAWALLITTVQTAIESARVWYPGGILEIGGSILLVSVYMLTLFVVPVFLFEEKSLREAIVGSAGIVRTYWREISGGLTTIILAFFIMGFIGLIPAIITNPVAPGRSLSGDIALNLIFTAAMILAEILIVCLYLYTKTGQLPEGLKKDRILQSLQHDPHV